MVLILSLLVGAAPMAMGGMAGMGAPPTQTSGPAPLIVAGMGSEAYQVERANPQAAAEFANGVRLNNAFAEDEALRAFLAAERLDPSCALCFLGEAWARAATINYTIEADDMRLAVAALDRAQARSTGLSAKAIGLIAAERARYTQRAGAWAADDVAGAKAAVALADRYPDDNALQVGAANAEMIAAANGRPGSVKADNPYIPGTQARLERVMNRAPDFTPALHLYMHLCEWQGHPDRALAIARRLGTLAPESGHMLHMASHIYFHTGRYEAAVLANERAAQADRDYVAKVKPPGLMNALPMHQHNLSFGLGAALESGDTRRALTFAREMQSDYPAGDLVPARAYLAIGRYLPVAEVLALRAPKDPFAAAFYHFARGEAFARAARAEEVLVEANQIAILQHRGGFPEKYVREVAMLEVPRLMLVGRAAMLRHDWRKAVEVYRAAAVTSEAREPYADPPLWPWSPRRSLAEALLKSGDAAGARREAQRALDRWPEDGPTLDVLARASGGKAGATLAARARKAWIGPKNLLQPAMI